MNDDNLSTLNASSIKDLEEHIELTLIFFDAFKIIYKRFYIKNTSLPLRRLSIKRLKASCLYLFEQKIIDEQLYHQIDELFSNVGKIRKISITSLNKNDFEEIAKTIVKIRINMQNTSKRLENYEQI